MKRAVCAVVVGALVLSGCGSAGGGGTPGTQTLVLYNGQHPEFTQALVDAFEKKTGIQIEQRTDDGVVLADQILEEGSGSPADVYLTENSPELMLLEEHHLLAKLPASITDQVPARDSSPDGDWVGVALRVSALVYDPALISRSALPASVLDLADPRWKGKVAIAPTDPDFVPLVGAAIALDGRQAATKWLIGLKANAALYQDDEAVVSAVNRGDVAVGVINAYYWFRLRYETGASAMHCALYYFPNHDVGSLEDISGISVLASSKHKAEAERFVSFVVSRQGQEILAHGDDFEYPVRPGVSPNAQLPPLPSLSPSVLSVVRLGDDTRAGALLQSTGLT